MITQEYLKSILHYDPETGIFTWIKSSRSGWNGEIAGSKFKPPRSRTTYLRTHINKKNYLNHQLAWLYVHGYFPEMLDHADENGENNAILNLRKATNQENIRNVSIKRNNSSGAKNVHWEKIMNKWRVAFRIADELGVTKSHYFGNFVDFNEAVEKAAQVRAELHGEFCRHE